jgi:hypothetical protein
MSVMPGEVDPVTYYQWQSLGQISGGSGAKNELYDDFSENFGPIPVKK